MDPLVRMTERPPRPSGPVPEPRDRTPQGRLLRLLQEVRTHGAWEQWVLFMLEAVEVTSVHTLRLVSAIRELLERTIELCRTRLPRTSCSQELVERLFVQPYVKTEHLVKAGIAERRTATKYLRQLEGIGVLESFRVWRETLFVNRGLYDPLKE